MAGGAGETTLEYTPTWVVATVCTVIVAISLAVERILHYTGEFLKKKNQNPLFEALQKIKEELMLLGFISLLLNVFQDGIAKICMPKSWDKHWLPCKKKEDYSSSSTATTAHFQSFFSSFISGSGRRLLAKASDSTSYCQGKNNLQAEAMWGKDRGYRHVRENILHLSRLKHAPAAAISRTIRSHCYLQLRCIIFIPFVLAVVHVTFCALTILFGGAKIRQWKHWEDSILKKKYVPGEVVNTKFTHVQDHAFIKGRFQGIGKNLALLGWVHSFFKQFYASVTKSDYITLRLGFIMTHSKGNPKFNFHKYMIRALEDDFKKVIGISWYLWLFVVVFLFLNVYGANAYFWIAFIPFSLLLAVGTKLEHVISQLARDVAEKHVAIEGDLVVKPSDDHFWLHRPQIVLVLIHVILFQNSFEIAVFFWMLVQYGFDSCIMGQVGYIIPRLVIGVFVQFLCSYSTLPLYAIVTQMGSSFKKAIFEEHIQEGIVGWAEMAKKNKGLKKAANGSSQVDPKEASPVAVQLANVGQKESAMEEGNAGEIKPTIVSDGLK